jgi:membrane-bound serine protease (ClpP class)
MLLLISMQLFAQSEKKQVMVMDIKDEIDPRMLRYVKLAFEHADKIKADYIIIDMDTFGGGLQEAKDIVNLIMNSDKPIWVYINTNAISAGAFISIGCDSIYMSKGAVIGASSVVNQQGVLASEKVQSAMRSIMRSTAEAKNRNPKIAEGMVGMVSSDSLSVGKVISLTTSEAITEGYCEAKVQSIEEILKRNKVENYELHHFKLGATEKIIAFFLNPFISGILILVILGGIYFELQTPGVGFPLFAAITALVLYLVPYYLNGLAEYWEIIALFVGLLLIAAEVFILPGFGVAGVAGIGLTLLSLVLIMLNNDFFNFEFVPLGNIVQASFVAVAGLMGSLLLLIFAGSKLLDSKAFQRLALNDAQNSSEGFTVNANSQSMLHKKGIAHTVLRPSGKIMLEGEVLDAFTRGEFIEKGEEVEVIGTEGVTLRVKRVN